MVGWVTALKLVPWGDVIEATPQILNAAKKLLGTTRKSKADAPGAASIAASGEEAALPVETQLLHLRERVGQLEQEQIDGAALIQSLAQQNAQVIRAVEDLRKRNRRLTLAIAVLGATCLGLLIWAVMQ
ncbi:hypothetical protein [Acidovorax sp. RAC01]|uniref:hypothetical protein n=1 Tax=Acidovorax sp. RAC01 TaxID=1842533 RepID=UPI00083E72E1|nr:hypothetical protein [Acidovorax sp. RAC01]AOG21766.1 hypothetical protein BSY15_2649 [Acidovorax sp. RAC01]